MGAGASRSTGPTMEQAIAASEQAGPAQPALVAQSFARENRGRLAEAAAEAAAKAAAEAEVGQLDEAEPWAPAPAPARRSEGQQQI